MEHFSYSNQRLFEGILAAFTEHHVFKHVDRACAILGLGIEEDAEDSHHCTAR